MTLISIPLTLVFIFIAAFFAGGGHGSYFAAQLLFPYTMAATFLTGTITMSLIVIGLLQFPLYGIVLDHGRSRGTFGKYALIIAAVHLAIFLCALYVTAGTFR